MPTLGLVALLTLVTLGTRQSPAGATSDDTVTAPNPARIPLSGSVTTTTASWAVVQMGRDDDDHDLFWQLFTLGAGAPAWKLVTPPGVADNGGLMVSTGTGTSLLAGIGASQDLDFSPLALSDNGGANWIPGGLAAPLSVTPSAVALGADGKALALVDVDGQQVLSRSGALTSWKTAVTRRTLASVTGASACGVVLLGAVDLDPAGRILVGASCAHPGVPGLFTRTASRWQLVHFTGAGATSTDAFEVLRLATSGTSTSGLLAGVASGTTELFATWSNKGQSTFSLSAPLRIGTSDHVVASGTGPGAAQFVLIGSGTSLRAEVVSGPGAPWRRIANLPAGTSTVAFEPSGQLDALRASDTLLTVWKLAADGDHWTKTQSLKVPIAFGSSS